jgi:hypothetical protein
MPMFAATWYFLGLAGCLFAALLCFTRGKQAGRSVQVDLADLRVASLCLVSAGSKPTWHAIRTMWMKWYLQCQQTAIRKQKAMYSWSRTSALCAILCLVGVLLEAEYDKPISASTILSGFMHSRPAAASSETSP